MAHERATEKRTPTADTVEQAERKAAEQRARVAQLHLEAAIEHIRRADAALAGVRGYASQVMLPWLDAPCRELLDQSKHLRACCNRLPGTQPLTLDSFLRGRLERGELKPLEEP